MNEQEQERITVESWVEPKSTKYQDLNNNGVFDILEYRHFWVAALLIAIGVIAQIGGACFDKDKLSNCGGVVFATGLGILINKNSQ